MVDRSTAIRVGVKGGNQFQSEMRALGTEGQRALKKIEAAGRPASKSLLAVNAASREVRGGLQGFAARAGPAGAALTALGPGGLAAAAGIGATVIAIRRLIPAVRESVSELDEIAKSADNIGITTAALQELRFANERMGISLNDTDSGLEAFGKRLGELRAGTGSLNTLLNKTDPELKQLLANARDNDEALDLLFQAMVDTTDQADRLALSSAAFGRGPGIAFTRAARDGAESFAALRQEARDLGIVIDEQLLRQAERTQDQLTNLDRVIDANLNQTFINFSGVLVGANEGLAELSRLVREVSQDLDIFFNGLETASTQGLRDELAKVNDEVERTQAVLAETERREAEGGIRGFLESLPIGITNAQELRDRLGELESRAASIKGLLSERTRPDGRTPPSGDARPDLPDTGTDKFAQQLEALQAQLDPTGAALAEYRANFDTLSRALDEGRIAGEQYQALQASLNRAFVEGGENAAASAEALKARTAAEREAAQAQEQLQRSAESLISGTHTEAERLEAQIDTLGEALAEDLVADTEAAEKALKRLEGQLEKTGTEMGEVEGLVKTGLDGAVSDLSEELARGEASWQSFGDAALDVLTDINASLIEMALRSAINLAPPGSNSIFGPGGAFGLGSVFNPFGGGTAGGSSGGGGFNIGTIFNPAGGSVPGPHLAKGGVFEGGRLTAFQHGGIIDRPTVFPLSGGGTGLAGEAGDEAIVPLRRLANGDLGIGSASGGVTVQIFDQRSRGEPVEVAETTGPNGDKVLQVLIRDEIERAAVSAVANDLDRGGRAFQALQRNFRVAPSTFG